MKKNLKFILLTLGISLLISFSFELIKYNRNVITKNSINRVKIENMHNIEKKNGWYITTSKNSTITYTYSKNYIDKIAFKYLYKDHFDWKLSCFNDNQKISDHYFTSSNFINKSTKQIKCSANKVLIKFNNKNIKFKDAYVDNRIHINWNHIIFIVLSLSSFTIIIRYRKYFLDNLHNAFLFIAIIGGMLLLTAYPKTIYMSWDDQIHFKNAYYLFNTETARTSGAFLFLENKNNSDIAPYQTDEEKNEFYKYINQLDRKNSGISQVNYFNETYKRLVYFPFWLGFNISKILGFGFCDCLVFAKFINMLCYILIMYSAIKISTFAKKIIFAIGLFESNLFLATQFSYDSLITASLTLAFALFLRMLEDKKLNKKYVISFILAVVFGCLPKAIYCPILLLLLFVPNNKFDNKKQAVLFKCMLCVIVFLLMSTFVLPMLLGSVGGDPRGGNTNTSAQLSFILHNPINYCKILIKFFLNNSVTLLIGQGIFVSNSYLDAKIRYGIDLLYMINLIYILYLAFNTCINKNIINKKIKFILFIMLGAIFLLISTALYLSFTEVGMDCINGVQTRYFIPLFLPLWLLFVKIGNSTHVSKDNVIMLLIPLFTVAYCAFFLMINM